MRGHTYPDGVFQTGDAYPASVNSKEDGSKHRNGSYVEFINEPMVAKKEYRNGSMSAYEVEKIIVYERQW